MPRLINFCDLETTGLKTDTDRIVEIACVLYDFDTRQARLRYERRVHPGKPISAEASAVHGIYIEDLAGKPGFDHIAPEIVKILSISTVVVAHNGFSFDFPMLATELQRAGQAIPSFGVYDTIDARWATHNGKLPKLSELAFSLGVDYDPALAHAALYDVDVMAECFFRGIDRGFFKKPEGL